MKLFRMFWRGIKSAFKSVFRNTALSLSSISCIAVTLFVVALTLLISYNIKDLTENIKKDVSIVVFVNQNISAENLEKIEQEIDKTTNIESSRLKTKQEQKEEMMKESSLFKTLMEGWSDEESPLKDSFLVKVSDIAKIEETSEAIKKIEGVFSVNYGQKLVSQMIKVFNVILNIMTVTIVVLVLIITFLIVNSIKLSVFARKKEISIMRLVGASNFYIKLPFVIEGMILGALGSLFPILLSTVGYAYLVNYVNEMSSSVLLKLLNPSEISLQISIIILVIGIFVGMVGSFRAVGKYLKV